MGDYIRREDAFDAVEARLTELMTHPEFRRKHFDIDLSGIIRNISAIKPADVVPVVRCRDCRYRVDPDKCCHPDGLLRRKDDDFCSCGERKG